MIYTYADGNNNKYVIKNEGDLSLEYLPMTPSLSSSGIYSGGEPVKKAINEIQYKRLTALFNEAIDRTESHIKQRVMMSGAIDIIDGIGKRSCIIAPRSEILIKIEKTLLKILKT